MADALFSAGFLNSCLRRGDVVKLANLAPCINARGPLFVHPEGIVRRSTFHVMAMYANLLGERVLDTHVAAGELASAAHARRHRRLPPAASRMASRMARLMVDSATAQALPGARTLTGDQADRSPSTSATAR
jgi:alpha-L-arabinofuranosidase